MKTYKHLWGKFISFENLYSAAMKSQRGKRWKPATLAFNFELESKLLKLQDELVKGNYIPGSYFSFKIYEPKERVIFAAPYRDRIVHHALMNILEPIWEPRLFHHSYACRVDKGTHKALDTCQLYLRNNKYMLKCDIQKYFPNIDHLILKQILRQKIADRRILTLLDLIIDLSPVEISKELPLQYFKGDDLFTPITRRRGIPIGNLTSQFFANLYLNELDRWIKEKCNIKYYLRYMDDFIVFEDSKSRLKELREKLRKYLYELRLLLHPKKQEIFPSKNGVPFLGFHIYDTHRRIQKANLRSFKNRMKIKQNQFSKGEISIADVKQSIMAWLGHSQHGNTYKLRKELFKDIVFCSA
jgi:retron-type reverse transcriptase